VDTEVATTIVASVVITEMTEMVVGEVMPEVIVIQMIGRSEERKIGRQDSRTITTETTVGVMVVTEIARAAAVVEDVMTEDPAQMTETANAERKTGMLKLFK
jgi:stage III sporulation protein SpoIIIAA